jgi:hypothetical protein
MPVPAAPPSVNGTMASMMSIWVIFMAGIRSSGFRSAGHHRMGFHLGDGAAGRGRPAPTGRFLTFVMARRAGLASNEAGMNMTRSHL